MMSRMLCWKNTIDEPSLSKCNDSTLDIDDNQIVHDFGNEGSMKDCSNNIMDTDIGINKTGYNVVKTQGAKQWRKR